MPKTPEEAEHEYYLVLSALKLRYAPQYADVCLNSKQDAQWAQYMLTKRGLDYTIYDKNGLVVDSWPPDGD